MIVVGFKNILIYIDPASFFIVLVPTILFLKSQFSWSEIGEAFTTAFSRKPVKKLKLEKALLFFTALQKYLIWAGLIDFTLGVIALFSNFSNYVTVGNGLAVALLVMLYAFILIFTVALPFQSGLKKKLTEFGE